MSRSRSSNARRPTATASAGAAEAAAPPLPRWVLPAFFLSLFAIAIAFSPDLDSQFSLPKLFWIRIYAAAIGVAWMAQSRRGAVKPLPAPLWIAGGALVAWWIVALPFSVHASTALWGMPGRYNGLVNQILFVLIAAAIGSMRISQPDVERATRALVLAVVPAAAYAIAQGLGFDRFSWPNPRPGSTIGHPVPLAAILSLALPFAITAAAWGRSRVASAAWLAVSVLLIFAIGTTLSRGPWAGAAVAVAVVVYGLLAGRISRRMRIGTLVVALAVAGVVVVRFGRVPGTAVSQRIEQLTHLWSDPSFMNRFVYINAAVRMVRDRPLAGVGWESFGLMYPRYRPVEGEAVPADALPSMVHNGYAQVAATTGAPGLAVYLAFLASVFWLLDGALRRERASHETSGLATAFVAALAGYLVQDLSGWPELSLSAFFWTVVGLAVTYAAPDRRTSSSRRADRGVGMAALACTAAALALAAIALNLLRADRALANASRADAVTAWPYVSAQLETMLAAAGSDGAYVHQAGFIGVKHLARSADRRIYDDSVDRLERARRLNPFDPYVLIHRVDADSFALQSGVLPAPTPGASDAAAAAMAADPNNASVQESVARFALLSKQPDRALGAILKAEALRPAQPGYRLLEGDIQRALGKRDQAIDAYRGEAQLASGGAAWAIAERKWIAALIEQKRADQAVAVAEAFTGLAPDDAMGRVLLGIALAEAGDAVRSHEAFAAALVLDPSNETARAALAGTSSALSLTGRSDPNR